MQYKGSFLVGTHALVMGAPHGACARLAPLVAFVARVSRHAYHLAHVYAVNLRSAWESVLIIRC